MLARIFLLKRGECCGNGCLMCPYQEKHSKGSRHIRKEVLDDLEVWEKQQLITEKSHPSDK
jgi:uncharacterized protein (DUF779 family)